MKVNIGERLVKKINPQIDIIKIPKSLISQEAFDAIIASDYVFGCVDREGLRLILTELCSAYSKPYLDVATDIIPENPPNYGGRVCVAWDGHGCLYCCGELDVVEAQSDLMNPAVAHDRETIYGIPRKLLHETGPSVVSINGVVASLAVTEFMLMVTGIRNKSREILTYRAHMGFVSVKIHDTTPDCYYCKTLWGVGEDANIYRYLRAGIKL